MQVLLSGCVLVHRHTECTSLPAQIHLAFLFLKSFPPLLSSLRAVQRRWCWSRCSGRPTNDSWAFSTKSASATSLPTAFVSLKAASPHTPPPRPRTGALQTPPRAEYVAPLCSPAVSRAVAAADSSAKSAWDHTMDARNQAGQHRRRGTQEHRAHTLVLASQGRRGGERQVPPRHPR